MIKTFKLTLTVLLCLAGLSTIGYYTLSKYCTTSLMDIKHPKFEDLKLVISKKNCGATTSVSYVLEISDKEKTKKILVAEGIDEEGITWENENKLNIPVERVHQFTNFFYTRSAGNLVEIRIELK